MKYYKVVDKYNLSAYAQVAYAKIYVLNKWVKPIKNSRLFVFDSLEKQDYLLRIINNFTFMNVMLSIQLNIVKMILV